MFCIPLVLDLHTPRWYALRLSTGTERRLLQPKTGEAGELKMSFSSIKDYCENAVPNVSLCEFKRVKLAAGESITTQIPIPERAFTAVNENGIRKRYGSRFTIFAGTHQPDELSEKLSSTKCVSTEITF